jgi:hypothetical protein
MGNLDGVRANIWTAQQVADSPWKASSVGTCTANPCDINAGFVETGYIIGTDTGRDDTGAVYDFHHLQQYASWANPGELGESHFGLANLNDDTWYNFQVFYSSSLAKWRIVRDGYSVWTLPVLGFTSTLSGTCGAEAKVSGTNVAVQCDSMQRRRTGGQWKSYNYNYTKTTTQYCVWKPYDFAAMAAGPLNSCP